MSNWQEFEINCTEYLNQTYRCSAKFVNYGGSNSKMPDIMVESKNKNKFGMEAKQCPAQCGQFVLIPNIATQKFDYSASNATPLTKNAIIIMHHMDKYFEDFKEVCTKGKSIIFDRCNEIFSNWVIEYYSSKMVKYFITTNYIILPVEKFSKYFDITASYRIKRSGSSSLGKSNLNTILGYISQNYTINSSRNESAKLFITSTSNMHNTRFILDGYEYMFSFRNNEYEIRKLSNTFNANVIFSISLIATQDKSDLDAFESELR